MEIGKLGVWALTNEFDAQAAAGFARRVEAWGYGTLWIPEALGRDPLVGSSWLLAHTSRLQLATGIANIYARDPYAALNAQYGLAEQSGGRFLLGLGVSHVPLVEGLRGHSYQKPIPAMRSYLEAMAAHEYKSPPPPEKPKTILAALGPKMLELARTHADGAHPYNVSPVHTAMAREILGPGKWLCPRAEGGAGDRSGQGARDRPAHARLLAPPAQLPQQLPPHGVHRGRPRRPGLGPLGRRTGRLGRRGCDPAAHP
jgi:probable F420-dependent oxidoreductase